MFFHSFAPAVVLGAVLLIAMIWRSVFRPQPSFVVLRRGLFLVYLAFLLGFSFLPLPTRGEIPVRWSEIFARADLIPFIPTIDGALDAMKEYRNGFSASLLAYIKYLVSYFVLLMPLAYFLRRSLRSLHSLLIWLLCFLSALVIEVLQLFANEFTGVYYQHVSVDHILLQTLGAGFLLLLMSLIRTIYLKRKGYSLVRNPERELERLRQRAMEDERRGQLITKDTLWQ